MPMPSRGTRRRAELGVLLLAATVRLVHLAVVWDRPLRFNDAAYYSFLARQPWEGRWFRALGYVDTPSAEHVPLPTMLFSLVGWMDDPVPWQRAMTVVTGVALVWAVMRLADRVSGQRAAVVAGVVAALYPNLWVNDGLVMSESISMLLVSLALVAAWDAVDDDGWRAAVRWGVAMGLGVLTRSEVALVALLVVGAVLVARRRAGRAVRPAVLAAAAAVMVVTPWVAFNLARFEHPVLLSTNDGTTWAGSNCDAVYYGDAIGGWSLVCVGDHEAVDESELAALRRADAVEYAGDHLRRVPVVVAARLGRMVDLYGLGDMVRVDAGDERPAWVVWTGVAWFWALAPLAVVGWLAVRRRARVLLGVPVLSVLVAAAMFYGAHRIRSSAEPAIVVLAAVGALAVFDGVRRRASVSARDPG